MLTVEPNRPGGPNQFPQRDMYFYRWMFNELAKHGNIVRPCIVYELPFGR